jgi:NAD(P)-dependent dehydrogenase (short-subunit alcohol dehydrogenase family)
MIGDFVGRRVLVTGALGTLGSAQVEMFAGRGAELVLLDRPGDPRGEARASELETAFGTSCRYFGLDLSDLENTEAAIRDLTDRTPIDILVGNAALIINKPFETFSILEYEEQLRINAGANFALARALAPGMKVRREGSIVTLTSVTLNGRWDGYVPYVASKGAVLGLTKALARELGPFNVRVNAVSPGAVVSEAENRVFGDRLAEYDTWIRDNQSLKTRIEAADVAELVGFLASHRARMITGQNFAVDGGW